MGSPASVGKDGCKKGVCTLHVNNEDMTVEFQHLGIQCVRKKDIDDSLKQRKDIRVDPYKQGFKHVENASSIDLNAVKLCFQAFLEDPAHPGKFTQHLDPVCSTSIFDAKARKELQIMDISDSTAPAEGGKKILIFCEKVAREDIRVKFSDNNGWEGWGDFQPSDVHKQYGIALKTPKYRDGNVKEKTKVSLTLFKPSDESESEPQDFYYIPHESTPFPVITSGHNIKQNYNNYNNDIKIKQEGADHNLFRMSGGYTTTQVDTMHNIHQMSPYNCQQPSPDSQSFANMSMNSPQQKQEHEQYQQQTDPDMDHLSGKLDNLVFLDNMSMSDVLDPTKYQENTYADMQAPAQEPRRGKRSQQTAALESGSNVVPRELARMGSEQLNTPNCSDQINNSNLLNCKQINDL